MERQKTELECEDEDEIEIGTHESLPSALDICFENLEPVRYSGYASETTVKIGPVAFVKNAP